MQILFLCSEKQRQENSGSFLPYYLTEVQGKALIEWQILQFKTAFPEASFVFAINNKKYAKTINSIVEQIEVEKYRLCMVPSGTRGSASSALFVASCLPEGEEIFIVSTNEFVNCDLSKVRKYFQSNKMYGGFISFESHVPKYSFIEEENKEVIGVHQYDAVTDVATTGLFYCCNVGILCEAIKQMIMKGENYKGNFYIASSFNEMILKGYKMGAYRIAAGNYFPLKNDNYIAQATLGLVDALKHW